MKIWKEDNTLLKVKEMIQTKPSDNEVFRYLVYDNDYQSSNEAKVFTSYEKAINYAVKNGADVINMSFGGEDSAALEIALKK